MAPSGVIPCILLALFHVGHAVQEGDQGQPPSPPPDQTKAMSNLLAAVNNGPGGSSPEQIILYSKAALLELTLYGQTLVGEGNSVEAHPDVKEHVAKAGDVSEKFVERIEQSLGTEMKFYKMSAAQKMALDLAWSKIKVKTSDPAQCLDLWCQGAKDVMDGLASDGSFAEATGCILVLKYLWRAIQELRTQDQNPLSVYTISNSQETSLNLKKQMDRRLADPPVIELGPSPATATGNTNDGGFYPGFTSCHPFYTGFKGVLHTFEASNSGRALKVDTCGSAFDTFIAVYTPDGTCVVRGNNDGYCGLQTVLAFPSTPGDTYSILVFGLFVTGEYTLTVTEMPVDPICEPPSSVSGGISMPMTTDTLLPFLGSFADSTTGGSCGRSIDLWNAAVLYYVEAVGSRIDMTVEPDCTAGTRLGVWVVKATNGNVCPSIFFNSVPCGISRSLDFPTTPGDQYVLSFYEPDNLPFAVSVSITSGLGPCSAPAPSPAGSKAWCEDINPLEYSLSGKKKKKAIEACLKYEAIIGDSALPKEIGQKIGLSSPGVFVLGAGVGLMAMVALTAVALKRRFAGSTWVPVPDKE